MNFQEPPPGFNSKSSKPPNFDEFSSKSWEGFGWTSLTADGDLLNPTVTKCLSGILEDEVTVSSSGELDSSYLELSLSQLPSLCRTKNGSKRTQKLIAKSRPEQIEKVVEVLAPHVGELMNDLYGNYMCQTLFQSCSSKQRLVLLEGMKNHLVKIAQDPRGTHSLQTIITLANLPQEEEVYRQAFAGQICSLATHNNASHVVQRLLATLKNKNFVIEEIQGSVKELATNKLGLCVVKKCVSDPRVMAELLTDPVALMQDPYGNYAIQHLLDCWTDQCSFPMVAALQGKILQLCIQKYASNVIEKCLKHREMREAIVNEIIHDDKLYVLLNSQYGCYVLRTAAQLAEPELKAQLREVIVSKMQQLNQKKLGNRWTEILNELV